jgi:hypothetical protein
MHVGFVIVHLLWYGEVLFREHHSDGLHSRARLLVDDGGRQLQRHAHRLYVSDRFDLLHLFQRMHLDVRIWKLHRDPHDQLCVCHEQCRLPDDKWLQLDLERGLPWYARAMRHQHDV